MTDTKGRDFAVAKVLREMFAVTGEHGEFAARSLLEMAMGAAFGRNVDVDAMVDAARRRDAAERAAEKEGPAFLRDLRDAESAQVAPARTDITLTLTYGTPVARQIKTVTLDGGAFIPLSERFFDGCVAVQVTLPPGTVTIDPALVPLAQAVTEARAEAEQANAKATAANPSRTSYTKVQTLRDEAQEADARLERAEEAWREAWEGAGDSVLEQLGAKL